MSDYKCFVDSNIFLRTLTGESGDKFRDCQSFLAMVKEGQIQALTSSLVLAEVTWVLLKVYKFPKEKVLVGIHSILSLDNLNFIDEANQNLATQIYEAHSIKFIDALIASNPKIQNKEMTIVSYDDDFDKLNIIRKEPKEMI